ncbi:MAG: hypothetical protein SH847_12490 [Roseiflexaceae bacterium]|nr:hypothetical protein [Roseiflexaceae bacterium]
MTSASADESTHLDELTAILRRRRRILETQYTRFGHLTPDHIVLELEDVQRQLTQVQAELRRVRPQLADTQCPYLGLLTFQELDSAFFFGRDDLVSTLLQKVEHNSFLAVLGPSGSGKSSVVRAGLIPALKGGALAGSKHWCYLIIKPDARPLNTLAAAFASISGQTLGDIATIRETLSRTDDGLLLLADGLRTQQKSTRLVLVVDQAEELWTLTPPNPQARAAFVTEQQQPFLRSLLTAASAPDQSVLIIFTLRADFLHRALEHHDLTIWMGDEHTVLVSPLLPDQLKQAITRPAELVGCSFEPGLDDALVEQTLGQPGALPLLEYTLLELWKDRRPDGLLTWDTFQQLGGVKGGLARRADDTLAQQSTNASLHPTQTPPVCLLRPHMIAHCMPMKQRM